MNSLQFVHPKTHTPLTLQGDVYTATTGEIFPVHSGIPIFISCITQQYMEEERSGSINWMKSQLRRFPRLYVFLIYVISPVCFTGFSAQRFLRQFSSSNVVISIGSGVHRSASFVKNIDIFPYPGVDIVADAMELPLATNSVDGIVCEYLLEHVPEPQRVVDEIIRVLRPGGRAYITVPFVYPFHASPNDFYRWSSEGLKVLCSDANILSIGSRSGPTSAFIAVCSTWLSIVLSLGSDVLYSIFAVIIPVFLSPFKVIDFILQFFPTTIHGTASWFIVLEKKGNPTL